MLTPHITANNKCYDGNNNATLSNYYVTGYLSGETVTLNIGSATFANSTPGTHTVTASGLTLGGIYASNYTLTSLTATNDATINANPTVSVNSPSICANIGSATITATPAPTGTFTYAWTVPSGVTDPGNVDHFVTNVAGTYAVVITDANTCTGTNSGIFTINPLPTVTAGNYGPLCVGSTPINLVGNPTGGVWSGTGVSGNQIAGYTFDPAAGTQTLNYTYTDGFTCVNSDQATIIVGGPVTTASNVTVCEGTTSVDIPINVTSFTNVGNISLKMIYDPSQLGTASLQSNIAELDAWGNFMVNTSTPGVILVSGYGTGITLTGTLLTLHFDKGTPITNGSLTFFENVQGSSCEYVPAIPYSAPFCDTPTNTYYIGGGVTVNSMTANTITLDQTICYGGTPALLNGSNVTGGTISYQWQSSTTNATTGFNDIGLNGTNATYQPLSLNTDTWFRRVATSVLNSETCTSTSDAVKITVNALRKISGVFTYYNTANTLLTGQDITVKLYKTSGNQLMGTTTTNGSGYYQFLNLCPDSYYITATSTHNPAGSVNTTDAAQVNSYGVAPYSIEKVRFQAGDVGTSGIPADLTINPTDAWRIQQNFVNGTAFDNTWTFWKTGDNINSATTTEWAPGVVLTAASDLTVNMYGLCTGDFNRSFNPNLSKEYSSTLDLINSGNLQVSNNQAFDLPIHIVNASNVGSVSLILNFPADLVDVQDVLINGAVGQLDWAVNGNELRIGWYSLTSLNLAANANLLTLKLKTKDAFTTGNSINFVLAANPLNELSDAQYDVIGNAVLSIDVVSSTVGIPVETGVNSLTLSNYPNPFYGSTIINYELPFDGKVTLEIYNNLGARVKALVSEKQLKGTHSFKLDDATLPAGIYMTTLSLKNENNEMVRTIKLINNR